MAEPRLPPGLAPRYLSREEAAAYLGVSATVYDQEVAAGLWPAARRRGARGGRLTWDRMALDAYADRDSDLTRSAPAIDDSTAEATAEAMVLEIIRNAPPAINRRQGRRPKAA